MYYKSGQILTWLSLRMDWGFLGCVRFKTTRNGWILWGSYGHLMIWIGTFDGFYVFFSGFNGEPTWFCMYNSRGECSSMTNWGYNGSTSKVLKLTIESGFQQYNGNIMGISQIKNMGNL